MCHLVGQLLVREMYRDYRRIKSGADCRSSTLALLLKVEESLAWAAMSHWLVCKIIFFNTKVPTDFALQDGGSD